MAGSNYSDTSGGFYEAIPEHEVRRRLAIVQAAKHAVFGRDLSNDELDRLIEPTPCRRTRHRLARKSAGPRGPAAFTRGGVNE
jgi:hypothetical protein